MATSVNDFPVDFLNADGSSPDATAANFVAATADAVIDEVATVDAATVAPSISDGSLNPVEVVLPLFPFSE